MRSLKTVILLILFILSQNIVSAAVKQPNQPNQNLKQQQAKVKQIKATKEGKEIYRLIDIYSDKYKVDPKLVHAIILTESSYNPKATSHCGAKGLMQLMEVHKGKAGCYDFYNKQCNIETGIKHLAGLRDRYKGNMVLAVGAYNVGGANVKLNKPLPKYARGYVKKVYTYKTILTKTYNKNKPPI